MSVIQSIIIHDVIGRRKMVLDHLRDGFKALGFGQKMEKYPDVFEPLFVPTAKKLNGTDVLSAIYFPLSLSEEQATTKKWVEEYLQDAKVDKLNNFLVFTTGAPCLPKFGLGRIRIEFDNVASIFASTCLLKLTLPNSFTDKTTFMVAMDGAIDILCQSFNCV